MKKSAIIFFVFLAVFFVSSKISAQTLTFDRAYQDYQYNQTLYQQAYSDYQDAKNAYLANQTLSLKDDARKKTYAMLVARDQLMVVYLTALRTKISELAGLSTDYKNGVFGKIDTEVKFYTDHKSSYQSNDDLPTLFNESTTAQDQYKNITSLVANEALFDISLGQVAGIRQNQEQIYSTLKSIINDKVNAGKLTLDPFNHWFTDIDAADNTLKQNENTGISQIQQMYTQSYSFQGGYTSSLTTLSSSVKTLSQLNEFLTEVVNYIKNQK